MRKHLVDFGVLFLLASGACAYVALAFPAQRSVALHVYVLVAGGLAMTAVLAAIGSTLPRRRRSELAQALDAHAAAPPPVSELAQIEREVTLAVSNSRDLHRRLLPQLREIAEARLERCGKRPGPDTLGRWWELLRPDRPEPSDRFGPGIAEADLRALVADLQRME